MDPQTHIILWAFTEPVRQVTRKTTSAQNFQQAMDTLMTDIKALAAATSAAKKQHQVPPLPERLGVLRN
jgi:hypothetical protein